MAADLLLLQKTLATYGPQIATTAIRAMMEYAAHKQQTDKAFMLRMEEMDKQFKNICDTRAKILHDRKTTMMGILSALELARELKDKEIADSMTEALNHFIRHPPDYLNCIRGEDLSR